MKKMALLGVITLFLSTFFTAAYAEINRVRVVNDSDNTIYIHVGGYAPAKRIDPGEWKIYYYPFVATIPNSNGKTVKTSLLVATAGGKWVTREDGYTYLSNPQMVICLDYHSEDNKDKTGNRVWTIKQAQGFDKGCEVKGYQETWHQQKK